MGRRSLLKLIPPAVTGLALGSGSVAAQANYDRTVDIVDAGADNTGNDPIDDVLDDVVEDGTLVEFPPGTYRMEREHSFTRSRNVGLVGTGGKQETTLLVDSGFDDDNLFDFGTSGGYASTNVEIKGFTFDQTDPGAGVTFFWGYMEEGLLLEDIDLVGEIEGPRPSGKGENVIRIDIMNSDGEGVVRRVRANDGAIYDPGGDAAGPAFYVGGSHAGSILFEDCECAGWLDNGLYTSAASESGGDVTIRGGVFKNNDIGNVRIGGENTLVEDVTIIQDDTSQMADIHRNPRGLFCRNGNATVRNVDIIYKDGAGKSWPILIRDTYGDLTLENVTIDHQTSDPAIYDRGSDSLSMTGVTVKSTVEGSELVDANSDGDMTVEQSCFEATTGDRDGFDCGGVPTTISDTNINVTGATVSGSNVDTSNISESGSCVIDLSGGNERDDGDRGGDGSPVASVDVAPQSPTVGETVTLDGTGSSDPDGTIQSYSWTVERPSGGTFSRSGTTATFVAEESGEYGIALAVTGGADREGSATASLSVAGEPVTGDGFEVVAAEDSGGAFDYTFVADGPVTKRTDAGKKAAEGNDDVTDNGDGTYTVAGRTGSGYGDSYTVEGEVVSFDTATDASNYTLFWNGEEFTVGGQSRQTTFEVVAAEDSGGAFDYTFVADGPVTKRTDAGKKAAEGNDDITDNGDGTYTVAGRTGSGYGDSYTVEGAVTAFDSATDASNYTLVVDGEAVSANALGN